MKKMADMYHRLVNVERLRFIAAFGIVIFHTFSAEKWFLRGVGYAGLPIFLMIFSALLVYQKQDLPLKEYAYKRMRRLLIPWVSWSVIFAIIILSKHYLFHHETQRIFSPSYFLTGTSIHLWYLPYAFTASILIYGAKYLYKYQERHAPFFIIIGFIASLAFLFLASYVLATFRLPTPLPQWIYGTPAIVLGVTFGLIMGIDSYRQKILLTLLLNALIAGFFILLFMKKNTGVVLSYSVAIPLVCFVFLWRGKADPISFELGSLTYGIYLIHPLFISVFHLAFRNMNSLLIVISVFSLSMGTAYVLKKTRLRLLI